MASSLFEREISVSAEDMEFELRGGPISWADFLLNPRRLRGSDFLMRWSQGVWSEERLVEAVNETARYYALPYGPSGTAPVDDVRAYELYFERLDQAGLGRLKRPDLLIFESGGMPAVNKLVGELGGEKELPFTPEDDPGMSELLGKALLAVECENSLWRAKQMPGYGSTLKPMRRLMGKPGLRKNAVLPTVILKEEDRGPLLQWQAQTGTDIHIWQVFYDVAFGLSLSSAERLINDGSIAPTVQVFQAPGGAVSKKNIYKFYYQYAYPLGESREEPALIANAITDANGHILPYVKFEGGRLTLSAESLAVLDHYSRQRRS